MVFAFFCLVTLHAGGKAGFTHTQAKVAAIEAREWRPEKPDPQTSPWIQDGSLHFDFILLKNIEEDGCGLLFKNFKMFKKKTAEGITLIFFIKHFSIEITSKNILV